MKRKRGKEHDSDRKIRPLYKTEELLITTLNLQLEYNRKFNVCRTDLTLYRYGETIETIEILMKYNLFFGKITSEPNYIDQNEIIRSFSRV
jgi:hypothetical protein